MNLETEYAYDGKQLIDKVFAIERKKCEKCRDCLLVFVDNQMPIMNGTEASLKIREF